MMSVSTREDYPLVLRNDGEITYYSVFVAWFSCGNS